MEEKRRDAAPQPPSNAGSPASEPAPTRRRGGAQKRKASALSASNSSSTPSKRVTREKALPPQSHSHHNGPLTRARQIPSNLSGSSTVSSSTPGAGSASAPAAVKHLERLLPNGAPGGDSAMALAEEINREGEWEALEAAIEARFEAIRSRAANAHVVPTHCGWFSWSDIHPVEKLTLPSFFSGKNENRTPNTYMEIRNYIIKRFHANPNVQVELKDLSEVNVGELDARQEVMEFLDYWGLINFHPFPSTDSSVASADDDRAAEKNSLLEKLYRFESLQFQPIVPKTNLMTPAMTSGLFPETAIAEELAKQDESSVEYHCNSCSTDCSRKRYHCQKQADFDLCTDCFSNGKFGSGMSSSDFILMEPAEVPGVSGGNWTDQETLLLLEGIELYKENWNEIAEHVATKSKAQCILHFVQMPIEDAFVDRSDDDVDAICKETADLASTTNDSSVHKDASELVENKISDSVEGHVLTKETSKADDDNKGKVNLETPNVEDVHGEKTCEGISQSEDGVKVKSGQEADNDHALNALDEAFAALGYSLGPEGPSSFAEVGNPVMAFAVFLARLVGSDVAVASAHSSLKSMSVNASSTDLAARHCFILEDPPDYKDSTSSERDSKREGDQDDRNVKQDKLLDDIALSNDHNEKKIEDNDLEDMRQLTSPDDRVSEKSNALEEQAKLKVEEVGLVNCKPSNSEIPNEQVPSTVSNSDGSKIPSSSEESGEGTLVKQPCQIAEELKNGRVSATLPLDNNALQLSIKSNLAEEHPQQVKTPNDAGSGPDSMLSDKSKPQKLPSTSSVGQSTGTTVSVMEVDTVSNSLATETNESHLQVASISSQHTGTEKDEDMVPSSMSLDKNEVLHSDKSKSGAVNGHNAGLSLSHTNTQHTQTPGKMLLFMKGEDRAEDGTQEKDDSKKTKYDNNFEKANHAAVSTLAAAAVKAKLLAREEEDQIRQLASLLIEKQLRKLETKLAFFNNMDNVTMRVRELLLQSRQKLFQQRALIIASRFGGLPASPSRGVPSSMPINRVPMNFANSIARPQIRPPFSGTIGTTVTALPNPLASATAAGNSVRPSC